MNKLSYIYLRSDKQNIIWSIDNVIHLLFGDRIGLYLFFPFQLYALTTIITIVLFFIHERVIRSDRTKYLWSVGLQVK